MTHFHNQQVALIFTASTWKYELGYASQAPCFMSSYLLCWLIWKLSYAILHKDIVDRLCEKYFSLNKNYSFAISHKLCTMSWKKCHRKFCKKYPLVKSAM